MIRYNAYRGCPSPSPLPPPAKPEPEHRSHAPLPDGTGLKLYLWLFDCAKNGLPAPKNQEIVDRYGASSVATGTRLIQTLESTGLIEVERGHMSRRIFVRELQRWTA